jgi:DNA-binding CsgD family transcriptional regulator
MLAGFDSHVQLDRLSPAEREVLMLLADGLRNREIARRLWKSEKTIEKHVGNVFHKLDLDRTTHPGIDRRVSAARIYLSASAALDVSPSS